jgi:hypothetical protein
VPTELQLFDVIEALGGLRPDLSPAQGREEHRRENGNDGDDDQQFDERKGLTIASSFPRGKAPALRSPSFHQPEKSFTEVFVSNIQTLFLF